MQAFHPRDQVQTASEDGGAVSFFASQVVSLLASRNARMVSELREPVIAGLVAASTSGSKDAFASLLAEVRRARITLAALADVYIPEAARRMGEAWLDDQMSWMDVSIGVGRMQSLLREIGTAWVADQAGDAGHGTVLLLVAEREQHTLGPMVLMGQLRRYGCFGLPADGPNLYRVEHFASLTTIRRDLDFTIYQGQIGTRCKDSRISKNSHEHPLPDHRGRGGHVKGGGSGNAYRS